MNLTRHNHSESVSLLYGSFLVFNIHGLGQIFNWYFMLISYLLCQFLTAAYSFKSASSYCIILLKEQLKEHRSELVGK